MAYYKITTNQKGKLVAKVQVYTKDIETGKNKIVTKRIYNEENLSEAKFKKQVEKFSLEFEENLADAYEQKTNQIKNNVLSFPQLAQEFVANIEKNYSQCYLIRASKIVKLFNQYLESKRLYKVPINEIKVRDIQLFLNSFTTYKASKKSVRLIKQLPSNINYRLLARENIINRFSSYHLKKDSDKHILKSTAEKLCNRYKLNINEYFEDVDNTRQYSVETIRGYRRVLRTIFNEAIRYEWIVKNPVCATKIGAGSNNTSLRAISEKEVLSFSEAQRFLNEVNSLSNEVINQKVVLKIFLLTGIRKGEMAGLKWCDIDFENKVVHIRRSRLFSELIGTYEKTPKTKTSIRDIPLADSLIRDLKEYYEWFKITDKDFDNKLDEYYICSTIYRRPTAVDTPYRWLKAFLQNHGFQHMGCHALRHTYCSLLLSQNVPIQTVSKYMGHSDSTITLEVYSHFIPDTQDKVVNVLNVLTYR